MGINYNQYHIILLLDPHWTYLWKHYIYYKKETKVGSQNFGYQIWFCTRLMMSVDLNVLTHWGQHIEAETNGRHFPDDIFKWIFFNENCFILLQISIKCVCNGPIDNNSALVQIMARRPTGDKPLSEPMLTLFSNTYMHLSASMS